jgi:hypothetical protein
MGDGTMRQLAADLDGWEEQKPTGERRTASFAFSRAGVRYERGDSRIEMKLVDSGFNQMLSAPFAMMLQDGYEKSRTVASKIDFNKLAALK